MSSFKIRPRFQHRVDFSPEVVAERIVEQAQRDDRRCEVKCFAGFLSIHVLDEDRHFWSPRLHLNLEVTEDGETLIEGIYGPNAEVWALFFYSYMVIGVLGFIAAVLAFSQWSIGSYPWGFWILGPILMGAVALYITAQFGQKLGAQQTFQLHQIYEAAIGKPVSVH